MRPFHFPDFNHIRRGYCISMVFTGVFSVSLFSMVGKSVISIIGDVHLEGLGVLAVKPLP